MRISDWSSDVCSSDLIHHAWLLAGPRGMGKGAFAERVARFLVTHGRSGEGQATPLDDRGDDAAARLVDAGNHPEILRLARQPKAKAKELARNITIEQVRRSEENTSELPSLMRNSYAVFCLK